MQIHALTTGTVRVKESFLHAKDGLRRQISLFMPDAFSEPLPIHVWVIEHRSRRILVDTGAVSSGRDLPFARFAVELSDELPAALSGIGLSAADIDTVVLTHLHGDHMDGAVHVGDKPVLVHDGELDYSRSRASRLAQRLLRQPIPADVRFEPLVLDGGPFGTFAAGKPLTADARVVAVATPGHTPGHISIVCLDDDGHHVMLAGDTTDTLEQLRARRPDAVAPKPAVHVETIDRIVAYGSRHPTVYLPSHDPASARRLADRITL